jgi:hypothetical protein
MPEYTFLNEKTNEEETLFMSFREYDEYVEKNIHMKRIFVPTPTVAGVASRRSKPTDNFRDRLREIKGKHRGSNINTF